MRVLTSFSSKDVEQGVKSLGNTDIDILMKYIYRGFSEPTENRSAILLTWHEKVCERSFLVPKTSLSY